MTVTKESILLRTVLILTLFVLTVIILYYGRAFFAPLAFALLFAMLFMPFVNRMQAKGIPHMAAILLCMLMLLSAIALIVTLLTWQVGNLEADTAKLEQQIRGMIQGVQDFISRRIGLSIKKQDELLSMAKPPSPIEAGGKLMGVVGFITGLFVDFLLVMVYLFLFLYFRNHLKKFILSLVPAKEKSNAEAIIHNSAKVSQQYLTGMAIMIACLWVMYGIGFSLAGVKYALFFAVLCGLLELVPFVGNLTGTTITLLFSASQGANSTTLLLILGIYMLIQFVQTYLIEPLVVGAKISINPLFTIIVLAAGEMLWGIAGMVLALPALGIFKIICDHITPLHPFGMLIGKRVEPRKRIRRKKTSS